MSFQRFVRLYSEVEESNSTLRKVEAMANYFREAPPAEAVWALYTLSGRKLKRSVASGVLRETAMELSGTPPWLFEESYSVVGDLAETISLLVPNRGSKPGKESSLVEWFEVEIPKLKKLKAPEQKGLLEGWWASLDAKEIFLLNKLITGGFRVGVSQLLVVRAVAKAFEISEQLIAERLIGDFPPTPEFFTALVSREGGAKALATPYPFFLASHVDGPEEEGLSIDDYCIEWKWDGIRAQIVYREGKCFIWSRGEELITDRFPEIVEAVSSLKHDCVLDGELLAYADGKVLPFQDLQQRITRKKIDAQILQSVPAGFFAFDCLESLGSDLRGEPLKNRRAIMADILKDADPHLCLSLTLVPENWEGARVLRERSREMKAEGFILKRWDSPYRMGRKRGDWWKWKVDPYTLDAVLLYAQPGHGRRATLYTDYTFGLWKGEELVPFAKAYSGLTDEEIVRLDLWIRRNTKERFGPVRSVKAEKVFELAFEGISKSTRHKSGISVRFPRILRIRDDKNVKDADSVDSAERLLRAHSG